MTFKWTQGQTCSFIFTPKELEYDVVVQMQRTKKEIIRFKLSFAPPSEAVVVDAWFMAQRWTAPHLVAKKQQQIDKAIRQAIDCAEDYWNFEALNRIALFPVPQSLTAESLKSLRQSQVSALGSCSNAHSEHLPSDVLELIVEYLYTSRPRLIGELPMAFVQATPSLGFSRLLEKLDVTMSRKAEWRGVQPPS